MSASEFAQEVPIYLNSFRSQRGAT